MSLARSPRRRGALAVLAVSLVFAGAACSASGDDDATDSTTTAPATEPSTDTTDPVTDTTEEAVTTTTEDDDDPDPSGDMGDDEIADAVADGLADDPILGEHADCLAPIWVDAIGTDRLREAEDLDLAGSSDLGGLIDEPIAEDMVAALHECGVDLEASLADQMVGSMTPAQAECVAGEIDPAVIDRVLVNALLGTLDDLESDQEVMDEITAAGTACR